MFLSGGPFAGLSSVRGEDAKPAPAPAPAASATPAAPEPQRVRHIAIFVKNRADKLLDDKVGSIEEQVSARVAGRAADKELKISVISREDAINAVASFSDTGANKGDKTQPGAKLDEILSNNTSALRLAQNLNADYILTATITSYTRSTKNYEGNGVKTTNIEDKIRLAFKLLDGVNGGTFDGGTAEASKTVRATAGSTETYGIDDLLSDAADKLAEKIVARIGNAPAVATANQLEIVCTLQDIEIPDVVKNDKGEYSIAPSQYWIGAPDATVELNGVVVGTAPGTFKAFKGLNKIRLSRAGCKDWEKTINITEGMKLNVALQMTDEGFARWKQTVAFLQGAKSGAKLVDAEVEQVKGFAQMLRQSGYMVNAKSDTKVDTDLKGVTFQSIFR